MLKAGLLTLLLGFPGLCLAAETAAEETEEFDLFPTETSTISPETMMDGDAEFVGNPATSAFSWWPDDLVLAPIPGRSPEFGWSLALVGSYFLDLDRAHDTTPSSIVGAFGWYSENKSYAAGVGARLNLLDDTIRIQLAAAYADVNYRFFGIGNEAGDAGIAVRIEQQLPFYFGAFKYRFLPATYFGVGYLSSTVDTRLRFDALPPEFDPSLLSRELKIAAVAFPIEFDTRDNQQFPREGWHSTLRTMLYREAVGSDVETEAIQFTVNRYQPMRKRDVLAMRFTTRATGKDAPFFLLSTFGGSTDLRGYESGRYRDRMMYAAQAEYRWQPLDRWIFTGFAGVGEVAPSYSEFFNNFLPAAGIGARYVLSPKHKLNLSLDIAVGKHGAEFYFGIGEAF